jgi:hypothetical protein
MGRSSVLKTLERAMSTNVSSSCNNRGIASAMTPLIPQATEEILRYEPPAPAVARHVTRNVEDYGQTDPAGSVMMLMTGAATAAPARWRPFRYPSQASSALNVRRGNPLLPRSRVGTPGGQNCARRSFCSTFLIGRWTQQTPAFALLPLCAGGTRYPRLSPSRHGRACALRCRR